MNTCYIVNHGVDFSHRKMVVKVFKLLREAREYVDKLDKVELICKYIEIIRLESQENFNAADNKTIIKYRNF